MANIRAPRSNWTPHASRSERGTVGRLAVGILVLLLSIGIPLCAHAEYRWDFRGATYNRGPLRCNPANGLFLDWARPVSGWKPQIDLREADGIVKYESRDRSVLTISYWNKPYYNPMNKTIEMELFTQDLKRNTTGALIAEGNVGPATRATSFQRRGNQGSALYRLDPNVYSPNLDGFVLTVSFSDGGSCYEPYIAKYYFDRVTFFYSPPKDPRVEPPRPPQVSIVGTWSWNAACASGRYRGAVSFHAPGTSSRPGSWSAESGGGTLLGYDVNGVEVVFQRASPNFLTQTWKGTLRDRNTITGTLTDGRTSCEFELKRRIGP